MEIKNGKLLSINSSDLVKGKFTNNEVTEVADNVFCRIEELTHVCLPKVTAVGNDNFYDCPKLVSVALPKVTAVGNYNFYDCPKLVSVALPKVTAVGNDNFRYCHKLVSVALPKVTAVGNYNFYDCHKLVSVALPKVTAVGNYNFRYCHKLVSVRIGQVKLNVKNVDGYCYVINSKKASKGINIYYGGNLISFKNKLEINNSYVAEKGKFTAHGTTVKSAVEDLQFKIVTEKLKNEPIKKDTLLTVKYYRLLTGACDLGCREWMKSNGLEYTVEDNKTVEKNPIKAGELLPLLKKTNAYGLERITKLLTF